MSATTAWDVEQRLTKKIEEMAKELGKQKDEIERLRSIAECATLNEVLSAIREYYNADVACTECTSMLLSNGLDPEPARLMQVMMKARAKVFRLAGF